MTDQVEWLWLLHDDCEPAADALEQLLRGAAETPTAAVLGPKLMDWTDRDVIVEAGLSLDTAGRRITGVEPREVDQGQHDGDRDALAVSSAGMLVRRDIWEQTGGFDPGMALFGEDIDFCWRVHAAGFRVRVITDAVVYHAAAATRGRRPISVGRRARLLERRNGAARRCSAICRPAPMLASLRRQPDAVAAAHSVLSGRQAADRGARRVGGSVRRRRSSAQAGTALAACGPAAAAPPTARSAATCHPAARSAGRLSSRHRCCPARRRRTWPARITPPTTPTTTTRC